MTAAPHSQNGVLFVPYGETPGLLSVEDALGSAALVPVANLGFAHVDLQRRDRCGFPEVIFCEGKTCAWVEAVVQKLIEADDRNCKLM